MDKSFLKFLLKSTKICKFLKNLLIFFINHIRLVLKGLKMILEYSIENTFSIKEKQTISFEAAMSDSDSDNLHCKRVDNKNILKIACLYGANASGKTRMLKALYFYMNFILSSFTDLKPNEPTHFVPFLFSEETRKAPGKFELLFYAKDCFSDKIIRYKYDLQLTEKAVITESLYYAPKGQLKLLFERFSDNKIKWGFDITGAKKNITELTRNNCSVISAGAQANNRVFKFLYNYLSKRFAGVITTSSGGLAGYTARRIDNDGKFKQKVLALLNSADLGHISDIQVDKEDIPDEFIKQLPPDIQEKILKQGEKPQALKMALIHNYNQKGYDLPLSDESSGTQRLLELSAPLLDVSTDSLFLMIDELESSLHQTLVETFINLFLQASALVDNDSQLFFTTHNQELLDSGLLRDDEVWFCYKDENGGSFYNSISDFTGIRKEASRKRLYQSGKFGALPNIDMTSLLEYFGAKKNKKSKE